jgi:hypothetical protein
LRPEYGRCRAGAEREIADGLDDLVQRIGETELDAFAADHQADLADPLRLTNQYNSAKTLRAQGLIIKHPEPPNELVPQAAGASQN